MINIEDKIIGIYGHFSDFSRVTGISVPKVCQVIAGKDVLSDAEKRLFNAALGVVVFMQMQDSEQKNVDIKGETQ